MKNIVFVLLVLVLVATGIAAYLYVRPSAQAGSTPVAPPNLPQSVPPEKTLTGHAGLIYSVDFSFDSRMLASSGDDRTVRLWDVQTGAQKQSTLLATDVVSAVAFSPDAKSIAVGTYSKDSATTIYVDAIEEGKIGATSMTLRDPFNLVSTVAFTQNGQRLVAAVGSTVNIWDLTNGEQKAKLEAGPNASGAVSPDGKTILTGSTNENEVRSWWGETGVLNRSWVGHEAGPIAIRFSPDGKLAASGGYDTKIMIWDAANGIEFRSLVVPDHDLVTALRFSADGTHLAAALPHAVRVWKISEGTVAQTIRFEGPRCIAFSADGKWLAVGGEEGSLSLIALAAR